MDEREFGCYLLHVSSLWTDQEVAVCVPDLLRALYIQPVHTSAERLQIYISFKKLLK